MIDFSEPETGIKCAAIAAEKKKIYVTGTTGFTEADKEQLAEYAKKIGADAVAHGSTGAGNDQVRFDMIFNIMIPGVEIITPIRDLQLSRDAEIEYLKSKGVEMDWSKAQYSINQGIWGTSVGGKETLIQIGSLYEVS